MGRSRPSPPLTRAPGSPTLATPCLLKVRESCSKLASSSLKLLESLNAEIDAAATIISELPQAIAWFFPSGNPAFAVGETIVSVLHAALTLMNAAASAIAAAGWFAGLLSVGVDAVKVLMAEFQRRDSLLC